MVPRFEIRHPCDGLDALDHVLFLVVEAVAGPRWVIAGTVDAFRRLVALHSVAVCFTGAVAAVCCRPSFK